MQTTSSNGSTVPVKGIIDIPLALHHAACAIRAARAGRHTEAAAADARGAARSAVRLATQPSSCLWSTRPDQYEGSLLRQAAEVDLARRSCGCGVTTLTGRRRPEDVVAEILAAARRLEAAS